MIEVLVAMLATALLLAAVFGVFSGALHLREEAERRTREVRLWTRAVAVLRDDLRQALVTGGRLAAVIEGSPEAPGSRFPGYLKLTTTTGLMWSEVPAGDVQEVQYFIREDLWATNRNAGVLVRALDGNLLASVRETTREETLLANVEALEVEFFDGNNWVESWQFADADSPLPEAVQVRIRRAAVEPGGIIPPPLEVLVPWTTQPATTTVSGATNAPSSTGGEGGGGGGGGGGGTGPPGSGGPGG